MLDHGQSPRLGQRAAKAGTNVSRVSTDADRPANAHHGQVVYVSGTAKSYIWSDDADDWEPFGGGIEFYAQDTPPTSAGYGAFWLDTAP